MSPTRQLPHADSIDDIPPLPEIYILWHPECAHGAAIAWQIRQWLRPAAGKGPQIFYRAESAPGGGTRLPLPLPGEARDWPGDIQPKEPGRTLQIVIPLLDHHMVADPAWRWWLEQLSENLPTKFPRIFLPVALTRTAFNAPAAIAKQNFLRIPDVLDLRAQDLWVQPLQSPLLGPLLKPLTETLCKIVLTEFPADVAGSARKSAPLRIFISHAKVDGAGPASRLRDYIYSRTQLAAFFDENNIPYGDNFSAVLEQALDAGETAALIAMVSDAYASRPWCRKELRAFCQPRRIMSGRAEVWALQPVLFVDVLEGKTLTRGLTELATVPVLRWRDDLPGFQQEETVITTLLREVFFDGYARLVARHFALTESEPRIILSWKPDAVTLLHVLADQPDGRNKEITVLYPGRELSSIDEETLHELFPRITFLSFAEADIEFAQ